MNTTVRARLKPTLRTAIRNLSCVVLVSMACWSAHALALLVGFHEVASSGVNAGTIAVNVPTGTRVGDVMLAGITARTAPTITAPAGWTLVNETVDAGDLRSAIYYRVVTGAEPASYTWTLSASNRAAGVIATYRGVDTSSPIAVSGGQANASSTSITAPSVTTPVANVRLVGFFSVRATTTTTAPTGMIERADQNSGGTGASIAITDELDATAGASGTRVATAAAAGINIGQLVGLRPASTVPGTVVWYRMDEGAWTGAAGEVADSSGNGLNGTALGGATTAAGVKCRAGSFSGSPTRVDVAHNAKLNMQSTMTVTGWIRPNSWPASDLMSFFSKDDNYEFHVAPNGQINWWWNSGGAALFTPNNTAPIGQWTFVAFVYTRSEQTIWAGNTTTAVTARVSGTDTSQLNTNALKLQIGDDQDFGGGSRRFNGLLDDFRLYDVALTQAEVDAIRSSTNPCGVDHYRVQNNATGVNCQAENVTITAHDASHNAVTLNNGTMITVTAGFVSGAGAGNRGDWSIVTGGGTLNNGTADDGVATYTFAAGGESSVVLALKDTWAQTVNITVTDGTATDTSGTASADTGYNQNLAFSAAGFRFVDASNNLVPNQVAGVTSGILALQAIQSSACGATGACTGVCTVPTGFGSGSSVSVELASQCVNPGTCQAGQLVSITNNGTSTIVANNSSGVTAYTTKSLLFGANGVANFTLAYPDVGSIRLAARYTIPLGTGGASSNTMTGTSNAFVVKPYSFRVTNVMRDSDGFANPGAANATGAAFIRAGANFRATVTAVNFVGTATPNYGLETPAESARLISTLVGGLGLTANPGIGNPTAFGTFSGGAASGTTFSWSEVGIITLSARVGDSDYLGAGDASTFTQTTNVGRFTPNHFTLSGTGLVNRTAAACSPASTFTYMGEGMGLTYTLTARALGGSITQNYVTSATAANNFARLPSTAGGPVAPTMDWGAVNGTTNLSTRLDASSSSAITWTAGVANVTATVNLARGTTVDGPYASLAVGIAPQDADGIGLQTSAYDINVDAAGGNDHARIGTTEVRFGRLRVYNAVSSELIALPVPLEVQYFNGTGFVVNVADSCTRLQRSDVIFRNFTKNLAACETGMTTPPATLSFTSGRTTLRLNPPGAGNDGSVDLNPRLTSTDTGNVCLNGASSATTNANVPWLQFNWSGGAGFDQNPTGRAAFGLSRKPSELIYFREMY